jgi:polyhydroxybutyrate depolymerase
MKSRLVGLSLVGASVAVLLVSACSSDSPSDGTGSAGSVGQAGMSNGQAGTISNPTAGASTAGTSAAGASAAGQASGGSSQAGASSSGGAAAGTASGGSVNAGSGGGGGAGGQPTGPKSSAGCTKPAAQALNMWVDSMVMTSGANRPYAVRLPTGYEPTRAYPVIMLLHGCSSGTNNVPMDKVTGSDAILVRGTGSAANTCWDTKANGPDVAFFDAMVADVKTRFCADESRIFAVGYSSGSWLINQLSCIRADVLRGAGTVSGGEAAGNNCSGAVARIYIHDSDDNDNVVAGSIKARDRQLTQNGCDKAVAPVATDPAPCQAYASCPAAEPITWCQTSGKMHGRQDDFAPGAFWNFFKKL